MLSDLEVFEGWLNVTHWQGWLDDPISTLGQTSLLEILALFLALSIVLCCLAGCCCACCRCCCRCCGRGGKAPTRRRGAEAQSLRGVAPAEPERERSDYWALDVASGGSPFVGGDASARLRDAEGMPAVAHPAYGHDQPLEIYSAKAGQWLAANVQTSVANAAAAPPNSKDSAQIVYEASLCTTSRSHTLHNVSLDVLRERLRPTERCEVFVTAERRWRKGEVGLERKIWGEKLMYSVRLDGTASDVPDDGYQEVAASFVRRRFEAEAQVEVYRGEVHGWHRAKVLKGRQGPVQEEDVSVPAARSYWTYVPVTLLPGDGAKAEFVASFLLRPSGHPFVTPLADSDDGLLLEADASRPSLATGAPRSRASTASTAAKSRWSITRMKSSVFGSSSAGAASAVQDDPSPPLPPPTSTPPSTTGGEEALEAAGEPTADAPPPAAALASQEGTGLDESTGVIYI